MPPEAPEVAMLMGDRFARLAEQQGSRELLRTSTIWDALRADLSGWVEYFCLGVADAFASARAAAKTAGRDRKYGLAQEGIA